MYGTIAKMRLKPDADLQALVRIGDLFAARKVEGFITEYFYQTDADPQVCYIAAVFESEAAYRANAVSPAQHEEYLQMLTLLDGEPEWFDGKIIYPVR